ncbi:MAG: porin family protein [Bacteroidota bacterium]
MIIKRQADSSKVLARAKKKKYYFILGVCLGLILSASKPVLGQAQRFKAGFNVGLTAAQIDGDESAKFNKLGLSAGLRAYTILTPKSDLIIEILFSQRGSRTQPIVTGALQRKINLYYIEVPVIYTFKDWYQDDEDYHKMHFQAGLSYGRLFNSEFTNSGLAITQPFLRENDVSWLAGITFHINAHTGFYARYTRSFNLLYKNSDANPNANSLLSYFLTFGGVYVF